MKLIVFSLILSLFSCTQQDKKDQTKPNIICIYTDQQSETMMSCAGNEYLETPAMDYIAENGIRFTRAYTTNPVCSPARVSMMTGRFPGYFEDNKGNQVRENIGAVRIPEVNQEVKNTTIAAFLRKAGYNLVYGGKRHLPKCLIPDTLGFDFLTKNERSDLAGRAADYIKQKHERPYFMIVSFINPHDICYMAIRDFMPPTAGIVNPPDKIELKMLDSALQKPAGISENEFFADVCPPLPPNHQPQIDEPEAVKFLLEQREFRQAAREKYTDEQWRMHRYAYCRLTEMVDAKIQIILNALEESGQLENTLVIFSSDHGDNDAAHKLEHKTVLYEESANIPFMAMWKGKIPAGRLDSTHLISNGLDLLPTVCDYAGVEGVSDSRGRSLRPLFEGKETAWRKTLGVESEIGRMVVSEDNYKYIKYDKVGIEEQLLDLNKDPYEKKHFTNDSSYTVILSNLRKVYEEEWFPEV